MSMITMVERYPIRTFLILTFAYSWTIWSLSPLISFGHQDLQTLLDLVGAFGPSLVAIIIVMVRENIRLMPNIKTHLMMFVLTFSMLLFAVPTVFEMAVNVPTVIGMLILADVAAYVLGMVIVLKSKHPFFNNVLRYVYQKRWVFVALFLFPLLMVLGSVIDVSTGAAWPSFLEDEQLVVYLVSAVLTFVALAVLGGALGQELGWRGFLTDGLLAQYHPILIGFLVGFLWAFWHAPLYFNGFYEAESIELAFRAFLLRFVWNIPLGLLFTWLYIRSKASTLLAVIMHASVSVSQQVLPITTTGFDYGILLMIVLLALIVFVDPMMRSGKKARHFLYK